MASGAALATQLLNAPDQVDKIKLLKNESFVFNFVEAAKNASIGQDGFLVATNRDNFPALLTGNGAMAVGVLGPCGLNSPHIHPRGTEIQIVVTGGPVQMSLIMENGAQVISNTVNQGSAHVFPVGSLHFQQSLSCSPTTFVASFDNSDAGTLSIAPDFFELDKGVIAATLGDTSDVVQFLDHLMLPPNVVLGAQECLDRCGIKRDNFNFTATFGEYITFSNSSWTMPSPVPSSVGASYYNGAATPPAGVAKNLAITSDGSFDVPFSQNPLRSTVIGLGAASAALLLAFVAMLTVVGCRRRNRRLSGTKVIVPPPFRETGSRGYPYTTPYDDSETFASRSSTEKA